MGRVTPSHYLAMMRNMVTSLIKHETIQTTHTKAKDCQSYAEKMVSLAKKGDYKSKIRARAFVREDLVVDKLFTTLAERYRYRPGGFTRVVKYKNRLGDNAPISILEFVDRSGELRPATICTPQYFKAKTEQMVQQQNIQKERRL